jgi:hypothetical protein
MWAGILGTEYLDRTKRQKKGKFILSPSTRTPFFACPWTSELQVLQLCTLGIAPVDFKFLRPAALDLELFH